MKRLNITKVLVLTIAICAFAINITKAQTYGNEWINFNQSYFKFKVAAKGIVTIPAATLSSNNLGNVAGSQFAIYRDGKEVPIYVSTNGTFSSTDYIQLYVEEANGHKDSILYANPEDQPNVNLSIISDTATYFLTYSSGTHQRLSKSTNTPPSVIPTAQAFGNVTITPTGGNLRTYNFVGRSLETANSGTLAGTYLQSANFDRGEGSIYQNVAISTQSFSLNLDKLYSGATNVNLHTRHMGYTKNALTSNINWNNNTIFDTSIAAASVSNYPIVDKNFTINNGSFQSGANSLVIYSANALAVMMAELTYPRTFDLTNISKILFSIPSNNSNQLVAVTKTDIGSSSIYAIDITNSTLYNTTTTNGVANFYFEPSSSERKTFFITSDLVSNITSLQQVNFINYSTVTPGDFIILTHTNYINATPSYVNQYATYRNSTSGGSHTSVVVDVNQLYDQFFYGYNYHPLAIRNFLKFAYNTWAKKPEYCFIIGKGVYYNRYVSTLPNNIAGGNLVPTYGWPGSDNLFSDFNNNSVPQISTGRLMVYNNEEIGNYLTKVKSYESLINTTSGLNLDNALWRKINVNLAGGSDMALQTGVLLPSLNTIKSKLYGDSTGISTVTYAKNSTDYTQNASSAVVDSTINAGSALINFYGHGANSALDFNLDIPDNYNVNNRYPIFAAYGCDIADMFYGTETKTVSESYIASATGGAISLIANTAVGYTNFLTPYMQTLIDYYSVKDYAKPIGKIFKDNIASIKATYVNSDNYTNNIGSVHLQCILLQGDPALQSTSLSKPDYFTENTLLSATPISPNINDDSIHLKAVVYNLGIAKNDTTIVTVTHTKPGNNISTYSDTIKAVIPFNDTFNFSIPIDHSKDLGLNIYTVTVNGNNHIEEVNTSNNSGSIQIFISSGDIVPVYPYEYSIVHKQGVTLKASTLNPFLTSKKYHFEIDTTQLFNSSQKQSTIVTSGGGVIKWKPTLSMQDSTVYYWRVAADSIINGDYNWNKSSFIYLANGSDGWNQSHYYQYLDDSFNNLSYDNRVFNFAPSPIIIKVLNQGMNSEQKEQIQYSINNAQMDRYGCYYYGSIQISVIDPVTVTPMANPGGNYMGAKNACTGTSDNRTFEFPITSAQDRQNARNFLNSISNDKYIIVKNFLYMQGGGPPVPTDWLSDTSTYGVGNTLYDKLVSLGFNQISGINTQRTFIFFKKLDQDSTIRQVVSTGTYDGITLTYDIPKYSDSGSLYGVTIGPALKWESLKWKTNTRDNLPQNDQTYVIVNGITNSGQEVPLFTTSNTDTSIANIPVATYPSLKLTWKSSDSINTTAPQLKYWRVLYSPVPEVALNPNLAYSMTDSIYQGATGKLKLGIENLSEVATDSLLVKYQIVDANNTFHNLSSIRYRKLASEDTLIINLDFNSDAYSGNNLLFVEANPNNDQPEQYHPNNLGYINYKMQSDLWNPQLDVTFDGVHILDQDIVSGKPAIKVLLTDENQNESMLLSDTADLQLYLLKPNATTTLRIPFDGTICTFYPATSTGNGKNQAYIEYKPTLNDGDYQLSVTGKDKAGNVAGSSQYYKVNFKVINKSTITNLLNYPNPFSTSTAFVFTLTGSEIPKQFKVQILTVTGKVVKEITKEELGPLHVGRNVTEYKWDGKDKYGQLLGNGVYIYRLVTALNGKTVEHLSNSNIDKYFNKGYGKMYIMR